MPYYIGDLNRDPHLKNCPDATLNPKPGTETLSKDQGEAALGDSRSFADAAGFRVWGLGGLGV